MTHVRHQFIPGLSFDFNARRLLALGLMVLVPLVGSAAWVSVGGGEPDAWFDSYSGRVFLLSELDAMSPDVDGDGLSNADELRRGTHPLDTDPDMDGFLDGVDPLPWDPSNFSAMNGVSWEMQALGDADADGVANYYDAYPYDPNNGNGTNVADRDADGIRDDADPAPDDGGNYSIWNGITWGWDALGDADFDGVVNFWDFAPFDGTDDDRDGIANEDDPARWDETNYSPSNFIRWFWDALGDANANGVRNFFDPEPYSRPPTEFLVPLPTAAVSQRYVLRNSDYDEGIRVEGKWLPDCTNESLRARDAEGRAVGGAIVKGLVPLRFTLPLAYLQAGGVLRVIQSGGDGLVQIHAVRGRGREDEQSWFMRLGTPLAEPDKEAASTEPGLEYWLEGVRAGTVELEFHFPYKALPAGYRWNGFDGPDDYIVRQTLRVYEAGLAVDADRNGRVELDEAADRTSLVRPFRFWINEDSDSSIARSLLGKSRGGDNSEEVIDPTVRDYAYPSAEARTITCRRDLEDFAFLRLRVGGLSELLRSGQVKVGLRWAEVQEGTSPAVNLYQCPQGVSNGRDYLADDAKAALFVGKQPTARIRAAGDDSVAWLPAELMAEVADGQDWTRDFIFEGAGIGRAKLSLVLEVADPAGAGQSPGSSSTRLEARPVWLKLMHAGQMIDRAYVRLNGMVGADEIPDPWEGAISTYQFERPTGSQAFERDPDETDECVIHVHGWRMDEAEARNWSEMSFKRLWHLGYKGRLASLRWPTPHAVYPEGVPATERSLLNSSNFEGKLTYNRGEYRAWHSGKALAMFVGALQSESREGLPGFAVSKTKIFAHSMGNVVVGAAMRHGMRVGDYVMQHAAMAAMAYDTNPALQTLYKRRTTPDTETDASDPEFGNRALGLSASFMTQDFAGTRITNFCLPKDSALWWWRVNQTFKKPDWGFAVDYNYSRLRIPRSSHHLYLKQRLGTSSRDVHDLPEAMAFVTQARSHAAGAELRTRGSVGEVFNLGGPLTDFKDDHSAEWNRRFQGVYTYWEQLAFSLGLTTNPRRNNYFD